MVVLPLLVPIVVEVSARVNEIPAEESAGFVELAIVFAISMVAQEAKKKVSTMTTVSIKLKRKGKITIAPANKKKPIFLAKPKGVVIGAHVLPMPAAPQLEEGVSILRMMITILF